MPFNLPSCAPSKKNNIEREANQRAENKPNDNLTYLPGYFNLHGAGAYFIFLIDFKTLMLQS